MTNLAALVSDFPDPEAPAAAEVFFLPNLGLWRQNGISEQLINDASAVNAETFAVVHGFHGGHFTANLKPPQKVLFTMKLNPCELKCFYSNAGL